MHSWAVHLLDGISLDVELTDDRDSITFSVLPVFQFSGDSPVSGEPASAITAAVADNYEECKALGVNLVSLKQNLDTTLPAGPLTFQVLGAVAEFERELLRERVKAGMNQARRVGKHIGRPARRRLGRPEIEKIGLLRSQGKSVRQLAKEYGASQWMISRLESTS